MALEQWALPQLSELLPCDESELVQIISYSSTLPDADAAQHLGGLLGDSPEACDFIESFIKHRAKSNDGNTNGTYSQYPKDDKTGMSANGGMQPATSTHVADEKSGLGNGSVSQNDEPPNYAPPSYPPPRMNAAGESSVSVQHNHTNAVIEAAKIRAKDEQEMQQLLQNLQFQYHIYNSDIEPEHDSDYPCGCAIHQYKARKWRRYGVQDMWSRAVIYPGEKIYNDNTMNGSLGIFSSNPYRVNVVSPYGYGRTTWGPQRPYPSYHAQAILQTIGLNNKLNREAQLSIDNKEPKHGVWDDNALETVMSSMNIGDQKRPVEKPTRGEYPPDKPASAINPKQVPDERPAKPSKLSSFRKSLGIKSSDERATGKATKQVEHGQKLRNDILAEERSRWPDEQWRNIVTIYQEKVGMMKKITDLRNRSPIQYLHLLRAGYFEPIPVAWATQASNPLKFSIEAAAGWRGITPAWRGYEDMAEERLYWVLNHREGSVGMRMKPDFISEMNMARDRMAKAVEPPPLYFSADDTCHRQHTSEGYSKQVMPPPFQPFDRPEKPTDDTMILLDVSGSMDFQPVRPMYDQYMVTGYVKSTQPKNKDVAKAIIRRFTDAMGNHDHQFRGYDLTTFSDRAKYIGTVNHKNFDRTWSNVRIGGGTRVMTGWQEVKELHFRKHSESAIHHPVYGWQAGPDTPMLRLLLLLDGEATDMDEFELDLLGLSWAHVTIFLIGVEGCPHHHRHANELQRISDVNHHVSFVDAQGNCPERYVTHELLKRHLGYDLSMQEFEQIEELPPYVE